MIGALFATSVADGNHAGTNANNSTNSSTNDVITARYGLKIATVFDTQESSLAVASFSLPDFRGVAGC